MSDVLALDERDREIIHDVMRHDLVSAKEIEEHTRLNEEQTRDCLARLVEEGFLEVAASKGIEKYHTMLSSHSGRQLSKNLWQVLYEHTGEIFESEGELLEFKGNQPIQLHQQRSVWSVEGTVHVFAMPVTGGELSGSRQYLFSCDRDSVIFSIDVNLADASLALVAVGQPGSMLRRLDADRLFELVHDERHNRQIATLVGEWIGHLSEAAIRQHPPKNVLTATAGENLTLTTAQSVRTHHELLWLQCLSGAIRFAGEETLQLDADQPVRVPIAPGAWATAVEESEVVGMNTEVWAQTPVAWHDLQRFHTLILQNFFLLRQESEHRERERLVTKLSAQAHAMREAMLRLASVMQREALPVMEDQNEAAMLQVCRLVGKASGIEIVSPPKSDAKAVGNPLDSIARASRIRYRQVVLRDDWWKRDNGPLIGLLTDRQPVALLPQKNLRYLLVNLVTNTSEVVTEDTLDNMLPIGVVLYRSFPSRAIGPLELIRFGIHGLRRDFDRVIGTGLIVGLMSLLTPILTGTLFTTVIPNKDSSSLWMIILALTVTAVSAAMFQLVQNIGILRIEGKMDASVQAGVWDRLLNLPPSFFRHYSSGDLVNRAMGIDAIRQMLTGSVTSSILSGIFSIFSFALLFYYSVKLALFATILVIVYLAVMTLANVVQLRRQRAMLTVKGELSGLVVQLIMGISKLRIAGAERHAFAKWADRFSEQRRLTVAVRRTQVLFMAFSSSFSIAMSMVVFLAIGLDRVHPMATGTFMAFIAAFGQFFSSVTSMGSSVIAVVQAGPIYERAKPILETLAEVDEVRTDPGELTGAIELSHVSFRYSQDGPQILKDVSMQIRPGQFVAIVGPSGSGKSTIMRMVLGFDAPETGAIYLNGLDLSGLDVRAIRRQIGVVLQNGQLMPGSIFENIVGPAIGLTLDDAWEAARMVGIDEDIQRMPMGMHTYVMEGGTTLSGGQRQRLLIARAIVNRPRILLMDEATSALDNQSQAIITRSFENFHTTRIVIAHRLSTILNADWIYVVQDGMVVQSGVYEDLMQQAGPFAELVKRQLT
jgi:NHLM bacteriocin system ABC transporter ATP-binding protein